MQLTALEVAGLVAAWLWPFCRIAAFVTAAPVFGNRPVPARVRLGLAVALTVLVAPVLPPMPALDPMSMAGFLVTLHQVIVGLALGFAARLVFIALEIAGQQIAQLMGLGFAALIDPQNGIEVPVVSNFYIVLGTLVFLSLGGHLVIVGVLAESFLTLPVAAEGLEPPALWALAGEAGWVFAAALTMVLPGIAALLVINLAYGVMSRASPQLNVFAVGFPVTMILGFVVMMLTLPLVLGLLDGLFARSAALAGAIAGGGGI